MSIEIKKGHIVKVIDLHVMKKKFSDNLPVDTIAIVEKVIDENCVKIKKHDDFKGYYHDMASVKLIEATEFQI